MRPFTTLAILLFALIALAHLYRFEPQGAIPLKGRGETLAYLLVPPRLSPG